MVCLPAAPRGRPGSGLVASSALHTCRLDVRGRGHQGQSLRAALCTPQAAYPSSVEHLARTVPWNLPAQGGARGNWLVMVLTDFLLFLLLSLVFAVTSNNLPLSGRLEKRSLLALSLEAGSPGLRGLVPAAGESALGLCSASGGLPGSLDQVSCRNCDLSQHVNLLPKNALLHVSSCHLAKLLRQWLSRLVLYAASPHDVGR